MKKFVLLSVILFIVNISLAQFATMFNDTLRPFGDGAYANRTICTDDSFYYVGGVYYNGTIPVNQYFITKLDNHGNVKNKNTYFDTTVHLHADPYNSMVNCNNKIYVCLTTENTAQYEIKSKVLAINKHTLDTIWTRTYPHPDTSSILTNADKFSDLTAIKSTPDSAFILAGNYMSAGSLRSYLMKIDSLGDVLWTKTYSNYSGFYDIGISPDSSFYLPCTRNNMPKLIKVDKSGLYKWEVGFNSNSNPSYPISVSAINSVYVVVSSSYWYDLTNNLRGVTVSKINTITKSLSWEKNYILFHNFTGITLHQAMGVETLSDGSIIVSGTVSKTGADRNGVILKLNSNGDSLWTKTYHFGNPNYDDCQLNDLIVTDDGGFMGVGFIWSQVPNQNDVAWMFKTDKNGVVGFEASASLSIQKLKVWPNPASDYTKITIGQALNETSEIIIYNSLEQIVETISVHKQQQEIEINLHDFKVGLYYLELRTVNKIIGTGKLIKE